MPTKEQIKKYKETLAEFDNALSNQDWKKCEALVFNEKISGTIFKMFDKAIQSKNTVLCENLLNKSPQLYKDETVLGMLVKENQLHLLEFFLQKEVSQSVLTVGLHTALQKNNTKYAKKIIPYCSQIVLNTGFKTSIDQQKEDFIRMFLPVCRYHVFLHRHKGLSQATLLKKCIEEYESQLLKDKLNQELNHIEPKVSRSKSKI